MEPLSESLTLVLLAPSGHWMGLQHPFQGGCTEVRRLLDVNSDFLMAFATHVFIQNTHDCCVVAASSTAKHFAFMYLCHPSRVVV